MRKEIFAGNWKMYKTSSEANTLIDELKKGIVPKEGREYIIFPPSPYAMAAVERCSGSNIAVGMQNMYFENEGAFTGEVAPGMVKDCGCTYILIGHSERRHVFNETNEEVNKKVKAAFSHSLIPLICVGELLEEREQGNTEKVLQEQIERAYSGVSESDVLKSVVAYEPVWAIGTGKVATPEIAEDAHSYIRGVIEKLYSRKVADTVPVLYGGSVKPDNIEGLYKKENIDGVLVGGASLKADSYLPVINV